MLQPNHTRCATSPDACVAGSVKKNRSAGATFLPIPDGQRSSGSLNQRGAFVFAIQSTLACPEPGKKLSWSGPRVQPQRAMRAKLGHCG
jgi:hypothetical protein